MWLQFLLMVKEYWGVDPAFGTDSAHVFMTCMQVGTSDP